MASRDVEAILHRSRSSIQDDIVLVREMAEGSGFPELSFLLFHLHLIRNRLAGAQASLGKALDLDYATDELLSEGVEYAIQAIAAFGDVLKSIDDPEGYLRSRGEFIGNLIRRANAIHSRHTTTSLISLARRHIRSRGPGQVELDLSAAMKDPEIAALYQYFYRLEIHSIIIQQPLPAHEYVESIVKKFSAYNQIFENAFGMSPEILGSIVTFLLQLVIEQFKEHEDAFPLVAPDMINPSHPAMSLFWGESLLIDIEHLNSNFGKSARRFLEAFLFDPDFYDPTNLLYHQTYRTPILPFDSSRVLVSPELLLSSLNLNLHYTILEADSRLADEYKSLSSTVFVDDIAEICSRHGYAEVHRVVELAAGKKHLGDIDLICEHPRGHTLLVEAKNHTLPLDVYFKDAEATLQRLQYQRQEWEQPFERRLQYVAHNKDKLGISGDFMYVIVSKMPEILSHYSPHLVITSHELDYLLPDLTRPVSNTDIFKDLYPMGPPLSEEEVQLLVADGLSVIRHA
jgi:hypothetical protein